MGFPPNFSIEMATLLLCMPLPLPLPLPLLLLLHLLLLLLLLLLLFSDRFLGNSDFQMDFQNSENDADVVSVQSHEIVVVDANKFLSHPRPLK